MWRMLLSAASLMLPLVSTAQDAPSQPDEIQVTAGRRSASALEVPPPVSVLTSEEIEQRNPQVMTDLLRGEAGAFVQQSGPGQGTVIVRGLKGAEVLHLVDGFRLNNAFFRTAPSQYTALLDPNNIERLEVLRGPYAALYGSDAMGGVVQVLTPEERFDRDEQGTRGKALVKFGSGDLSRIGRLSAATGNRQISLAGGFTFMDYGKRGLSQPGQSPDGLGGVSLADRLDGTQYFARGYDFKTVWAPADAQEWMLSAQYFELPNLPRYNDLVPGFDNDGVPGAEFVKSTYLNDRLFFHLRHRHTAPLAFMDSVEWHLGQQVVNDDRQNRAAGSSTRVEEFNRSTLTGLTAQAISSLAGHRLSYGLELYSDSVDSARRDTDLDSGATASNGPDVSVKSRFPDNARSDNFGFYVFDEWQASVPLRLNSGLRYTYTSTKLPQADRALPSSELDDHDFTGNVGGIYRLTDTLAWTANLGRGFRAPNVNDLAQIGRRSGNRITIASPDLRPESVSSLDTGLKFSGRAFSGTASLFYSRYRDRITLAPTGRFIPEGESGCTTADGCVEVQNRNLTSARYRGLEGSLRWKNPLLEVYGVLNLTHGEQEDRGERTPANRVPPLNAQLGANMRLSPRLSLEPWLFIADRQTRLDPTDIADNRIQPGGTPGYTTTNLRLSYSAFGWLELQLEGRNLFDRSYREHGSGIDAEGASLSFSSRMRWGT